MERRRALVDCRHPSLSVLRQCQLLDISRSGLYYQPVGISQDDLSLMKMIDRQYLVTPFYGARKMAAWLKSQGHKVNRKRVRRLMQIMGIKAIYRHPRTSKPAAGNKTYPYLLSGIKLTRTRAPNSLAGPSPICWSNTGSGSAWMGKGAIMTTCS